MVRITTEGTVGPAGHERPWQRSLNDLASNLEQHECQMELLEEIDREILGLPVEIASEAVEGLFLQSMKRFSVIHSTPTPLRCYVNLGSVSVLLRAQEDAYPLIAIAIHESSGDATMDAPVSLARLVRRLENPVLFETFPGANTILLQPLYSPAGVVLCHFLLADEASAEDSVLRDTTLQRALARLSSQLAIAYGRSDSARTHHQFEWLWRRFMELELEPWDCFKVLAQRIPDFLPSFGPLRLSRGLTQVQLLTLSKGEDVAAPKHLIIRGTSGDEHPGTRIAIDRSICGLLAQRSDDEMPYFYDDPSKPKYHALYRKYLLQDTPTRTEFALRLVHKQELVGILNLESPDESAFNVHHRLALQALSKSIAPIVDVLEQRLVMNSAMQATVASSTAAYLEGLGELFAHQMRSPLVSFRSNIEQLASLLNVNIERLTSDPEVRPFSTPPTISKESDEPARVVAIGALQRLLALKDQLRELVRVFVVDIKSYDAVGPLRLKTIVLGARKLLLDSKLQNLGKDIRVDLSEGIDFDAALIFGSTLLKQHLYNLLHNAVLSIERRRLKDPSLGTIQISLASDIPPEEEESKLNETWILDIRDDGEGVSEAQLEQLRRFEPGVRFREGAGNGFALVAAHRYVVSIGGRLEIDSVEGEWFRVKMSFRSFNGMAQGNADTKGVSPNG